MAICSGIRSSRPYSPSRLVLYLLDDLASPHYHSVPLAYQVGIMAHSWIKRLPSEKSSDAVVDNSPRNFVIVSLDMPSSKNTSLLKSPAPAAFLTELSGIPDDTQKRGASREA